SLFSNDNYENVNKQSDSNPETIRIEKLDKQDFNDSMSLDLINELIEETENSEIISFEDEVHQKAENEFEKVLEKVELFLEDVEIASDLVQESTDEFVKANKFQELVDENIKSNLTNPSGLMPEIEIDPVFNISLEQISFEQITDD